jgi:DNA processing protein
MTEATIVIESADRGGSLITANLANDYNRDVFFLGSRYDKYSQGCNNLIKTQKANVTSAADLVYILNWDIKRQNPYTETIVCYTR